MRSRAEGGGASSVRRERAALAHRQFRSPPAARPTARASSVASCARGDRRRARSTTTTRSAAGRREARARGARSPPRGAGSRGWPSRGAACGSPPAAARARGTCGSCARAGLAELQVGPGVEDEAAHQRRHQRRAASQRSRLERGSTSRTTCELSMALGSRIDGIGAARPHAASRAQAAQARAARARVARGSPPRRAAAASCVSTRKPVARRARGRCASPRGPRGCGRRSPPGGRRGRGRRRARRARRPGPPARGSRGCAGPGRCAWRGRARAGASGRRRGARPRPARWWCAMRCRRRALHDRARDAARGALLAEAVDEVGQLAPRAGGSRGRPRSCPPLRSMRMSSGPSARKLKPRSGVSSCTELTPEVEQDAVGAPRPPARAGISRKSACTRRTRSPNGAQRARARAPASPRRGRSRAGGRRARCARRISAAWPPRPDACRPRTGRPASPRAAPALSASRTGSMARARHIRSRTPRARVRPRR